MPYQQITIAANDHFTERLADALMEHDALSAVIEDACAGTENKQAISGKPGIPTEQIWQQSKVIAPFGRHDETAAVVKAAAQECGLKDLFYGNETLEDQDWMRLTQSQFDPIQVFERLWITPSWYRAPVGNIVSSQLDPGLAFDTGSHPTTRLCLKWLDTQLKGGESVLDYGCGSGIPTIVVLKLGADSAVGVDTDEQTVHVSNDNAAQNNVQAHFYLSDGLSQGQFDMVVVNILANPLHMLGEMLAAHAEQGGRIVLSGLSAKQPEELGEIYSQWFDIESTETEEGWVRLSGVKH